MGLIVQPIVGILSDRTWNRFGRRLPWLIGGAIVAVIVMCLLPNAGSFSFTVSSAILFGLMSLMLLDTSINMAMQPFKMLVGDMVNEKQKGLAYSIQSFSLQCGIGSGIHLSDTPHVAWYQECGSRRSCSGYGDMVILYRAAILLLCVIYSLVKIRGMASETLQRVQWHRRVCGQEAECEYSHIAPQRLRQHSGQ